MVQADCLQLAPSLMLHKTRKCLYVCVLGGGVAWDLCEIKKTTQCFDFQWNTHKSLVTRTFSWDSPRMNSNQVLDIHEHLIIHEHLLISNSVPFIVVYPISPNSSHTDPVYGILCFLAHGRRIHIVHMWLEYCLQTKSIFSSHQPQGPTYTL